MRKNRLFINLVSNIFSFFLQIGINFILTPIIVNKVGDAAYGFIGLANNFTNYATIFTIVINSMASRFISIELINGNEKEANKYYTSVLLMNIFMSGIIAILSTIIIFNLDVIFDVPDQLTLDVQLTFVLTFLNLIISLIGTVFSVATFAKNRLDLDAIKSIVGNLLKALALILLFSILPAKIYYIAIGSIIYSIYVIIFNIRITKKIAPELKFSKDLFDKKCLITLAKSGIWNSINNLSKTLLTGIDLLITNIFIDANTMGTLSIAKTVPNTLETLLALIANIFCPQFLMLYSKNKIKELVEEVKYSQKIMAILMLVPLAGFIAYGKPFYTLWLNTKTASEIAKIQILSILTVLPYVFSSCNYTLAFLDTITNKLKRPVIATVIISVLSTITTIVLLKTTNLGVFAVAGVSSIFWIIKVIFFNTINAAINLKVKWNTFFKQYIKNLFCFVIITILFFMINFFVKISSWIKLFSIAIISAIIGYLIVFLILLNKKEKQKFLSLLKKYIPSTKKVI